MYELRAASKTYGTVQAVRDVDLRIGEGEFLVVAGPSGSGKTTLLQLLGALDRPSAGEVLFEGRDLAKLGDGELTRLRLATIGFVFQQFNLIPTLTAAQNVEAALAPQGLGGTKRQERAEELLASVGLAQRGEHLPSQLSGGEQQRVAIARALANGPRVVLADEPTGNLDSETGREIVDLLASVEQTVVIVTHDVEVAARAPRVVRMHDGRLNGAEAGPAPAAWRGAQGGGRSS
jgi:putative ABC transport system ATP-binding protein